MRSLQLSLAFHDPTWFGVLVDQEDALVASAFSDQQQSVTKHLRAYAEKDRSQVLTTKRHDYAEDMALLFDGKQLSRKLKISLETTTRFQQNVYAVLGRIPRGRVTNYGLIAKAIESAPRAVGQAVGSNPCSLFIPCHRVVPADMTLGNYSMIMHEPKGRDVKRGLLEREGVPFEADRIPAEALWNPR